MWRSRARSLEQGGVSSSEAQRTLVKSPPELWAELSDPAALGRHLVELGEIRVTRTEPEELVEWEGQDVRGTVRIEPSGWGTRVTLTVVREAPEPRPEATPEAVCEPEPEPPAEPLAAPEPRAAAEPAPEPRRGLFARLFRRRRAEQPIAELGPEPPEATPEPPQPTSEPAPEPSLVEEPPDLATELAQVEEALTERDAALLTGVLDRLGAAHHRPFSRA
jgi:hypothetical protein